VGWRDGCPVGFDEVGRRVNGTVGTGVGAYVLVGFPVGWPVGCLEGCPVGSLLGCPVGWPLGLREPVPPPLGFAGDLAPSSGCVG